MIFFLILQGGFRAVIWTDVFQCIIMFLGMLTVVTTVSISNPSTHQAYYRGQQFAKAMVFVSQNFRKNKVCLAEKEYWFSVYSIRKKQKILRLLFYYSPLRETS